MVGVVESGLHGDVHWFAGGGNSGFFGAFGDVAGLTEIEARVFLEDMDAGEGLEVVISVSQRSLMGACEDAAMAK